LGSYPGLGTKVEVIGVMFKESRPRMGACPLAIKDSDIRQVVLSDLRREYESDPDTLIIEELGLCQGDARVDIAVVNRSIHGFEIKSNEDSLKRLPGQVEIYSRTLESVTLVVGNKHLDQAVKIIPKWWGVIVAKEKSGQSLLKGRRRSRSNPCLDPLSVVQLLWRNETLEILKQLDLHRGLANKPRFVLWNRLVEHVTDRELMSFIGSTLKARGNWRSDCLPG
jgi:hypothetical protein